LEQTIRVLWGPTGTTVVISSYGAFTTKSNNFKTLKKKNLIWNIHLHSGCGVYGLAGETLVC